MTVQEALETSGIDRFDAEVLLAALLQKDRSWLFSHGDKLVSDLTTWNAWVKKRQVHTPVAYITQEKEFYGRAFYVDERVLIPRPSTEGLIDLAKNVLQTRREETRIVDTDICVTAKIFGDVSEVTTLVDIGAGSGCIAITLALELNMPIIATDISSDALDVAKKNAKAHNILEKIDFRLGSTLEPITDISEPFFIVSNPPYVPVNEKLQPEVIEHEPVQALFGGVDGAKIVQQIYDKAKNHSYCRGLVIECRKEHTNMLC